MSATLIRHLWRQSPERIAAASYLDCHVVGLHSVMLIDKPGSTVRMFVATPDHALWLNDGHLQMTLGLHSHHCDLVLHGLRGSFTNIIAMAADCETSRARFFSAYRYHSAILGTAGRFEALDTTSWFRLFPRVLTKGESVVMRADDIHTVGVEQGKSAAWFVYEGKDDPNYKPVTYSNRDLTRVSFDGMYRRPTVEQTKALIETALGGPL